MSTAGKHDEDDNHTDEDLILGATPNREQAPVRVPEHVPNDALDDRAVTRRRSWWRSVWVWGTGGLRRGVRRVRASFLSIVVTSLMAALAFWLSRELLGQPYPMAAPVLVWVALGIQRDRPPRRVAELGLGATIGVAFGELMVTAFGPGLLQFAATMLFAGMLGRLLDSGELFTSQLVLQATFIVTMPVSMIEGGSLGRWSEALLGCGMAIIASTFVRRDVGRRPRMLGSSALYDLAAVIDKTAAAWRTGNPGRAVDALTMGRGSQELLDDWASAAKTAREIVRVNPALWGRRRELDAEVEMSTMTDRAMRNARVAARLSIGAVEEDGANQIVADHMWRLVDATRTLAANHRTRQSAEGAREALEELSGELVPTRHSRTAWRTQMVESLLRSLAVDLMQVSGASFREAEGHLAR